MVAITISRVVEKVIDDNPFIAESLSKGIINYVGLAEYIKKRVEVELKKEVNTSAIVMSLRRLNEKLEKTHIKKLKFDENSDVFVKSDLFEITIKKSKKTLLLLKEIYDHIDHERDLLSVTQGLTQVTIISNTRNKSKIMKLLEGERIFMEINKLSSIGTTIPIKAVEEAGFFYLFTRAFALENIPIVELVSTLNELNFIINERDVPKAFIIFKEVIKNNS